METRRPASRLKAILLTALFCAAISFPLGRQLLFNEPDSTSIEARPLHPFPVLSHKNVKGVKKYTKYTADFENYYNDHFGFRTLLLRLGSFVKVQCLHVSPAKNVEIGKRGWLFLKDDVTYLGRRDMTENDLKHWRLTMERRQQWLARRGVRYIYMIAPNKRSIYPDYLPYSLNAAGGRTPLDQLEDYCRSHSDVGFVSLREPLLEARAKSSERIYFSNDTHWNAVGAYAAYRAIIPHLQTWFPAVKPRERSDFRLTTEKHQGDLARMIGLPEFSAWEETVLTPPVPPEIETGFTLPGVEQPGATLPFRITNAGAGRLKAIVLRDSFGTALIPFLTQHFFKTTCIWSTETTRKFEKDLADLVESEKPDIFIEERVERALTGAPLAERLVFGGETTP